MKPKYISKIERLNIVDHNGLILDNVLIFLRNKRVMISKAIL